MWIIEYRYQSCKKYEFRGMGSQKIESYLFRHFQRMVVSGVSSGLKKFGAGTYFIFSLRK